MRKSPNHPSTHAKQENLTRITRALVRHLLEEVTSLVDINLAVDNRNPIDSKNPIDINLIELALAGYFKDDLSNYRQQSLMVLHHLSLDTWTGYYSIKFHELIRDPQTWAWLPCAVLEEFFPEITSLNPDEQGLVRERVLFEREVLNLAFDYALQEIRLGHRRLENITFFSSEDSLYEIFYRQLSLRRRIGQPWFKMLAPVTSRPVKSQLVFSLSGDHREIVSLEMHELLRGVNHGEINPRTHLQLDPLSVELIRTNYPLELKLVH